MPIEWNEHSAKSNGGTEMMGRALEARLDPALLAEVQIFPSRVGAELDPTKVRVLWLHDTAEDPMNDHLADGGWRRFHRLVFVSQWQMQAFMARFQIPWSRCVVIQNAIQPLQATAQPPSPKVRMVYTPTPHRGLNVLYGAFSKLAESDPDIELNVYSSFELYGWGERDKAFAQLFDAMAAHPQINVHGTVPNAELRDALAQQHIFAYPSTWPETSCLCLMEAMSAGLICVHPNLGALAETAANWTYMYQYHEDPNVHAGIHMEALRQAVRQVRAGDQMGGQKSYVDLFYSWDFRVQEWVGLLTSMLDAPREIQSTSEEFVYRG